MRALASPLTEIGSFTCEEEEEEEEEEEDGQGTYTMSTLGIRPVGELLHLRKGSRKTSLANVHLASNRPATEISLHSQTWELEIVADIGETCDSFNIVIGHSASKCPSDLSLLAAASDPSYTSTPDEKTTITFLPREELFLVDRSSSTLEKNIKTHPEMGPYTLFYIRDKVTGVIEQEKLHLRIFFDVSVIELYANERFALSTRVYPSDPADSKLEIRASGSGTSSVCLRAATLWQR